MDFNPVENLCICMHKPKNIKEAIMFYMEEWIRITLQMCLTIYITETDSVLFLLSAVILSRAGVKNINCYGRPISLKLVYLLCLRFLKKKKKDEICVCSFLQLLISIFWECIHFFPHLNIDMFGITVHFVPKNALQ